MKPKDLAQQPKLKMVGTPLCETCPHRDECPDEFKKEHLVIRVIEEEKTGNCFGGYYCWGIPYNTIPFCNGTDWFWRYEYNPTKAGSSENKKLPNFPKVEEDFIIITDDNES